MYATQVQTAIDVFRVLESGDAALARVTVAPTFENREAAAGPAACSVPGPRGLLASSGWMRSAFDELSFQILDAGFDAGNAWVRLRMCGIQSRPFVRFHEGRVAQVIPATLRRIDFEQIHLLRIGEGGVTAHEAVRDDVTMLGQLGVFPPTPGVVLHLLLGKLTGADRRAGRAAEAAAERAASAL